MVLNELGNAKDLLNLWNEGNVLWMPVARGGETLHIYSKAFGEHLQRKITLMEQHVDDQPFIDPNYMWRMPKEGAPLFKI